MPVSSDIMGPRRCNNGGRSRQFSDSCGSRRELFNDCFLPQIGFATAVNAPLNFGGDSTHFLNSLLTSRARNTHCFILLPILVSCLSSNLCTVLLWIMHQFSKCCTKVHCEGCDGSKDTHSCLWQLIARSCPSEASFLEAFAVRFEKQIRIYKT